MKASPHTHAESPLTGSTLKSLVKRAKELGRTHFAYTDHGHLSSALKAYKEAKAAGLKFIPGIEVYFKDAQCTIVGGTSADRCKYFTLTMHCHDQEAYQALSKIVSRTDFPTIEVYEEVQQLWNWKTLEQIAKHNVSIVLGGVHCIVGKVMLAGAPEIAETVLQKLQSLFGDRINVSMICEPWMKKYSQVVEIIYRDGTKDAILAADTVATERVTRGGLKAMELVEGRHQKIISKVVGNTYYPVDKEISQVKLHKGFLPLPGGDATLAVNKFLYTKAVTKGLRILATDYAYFANKEDKIVQTMRLEGTDKLQPTFSMKDPTEIYQYLTGVLGLQPAQTVEVFKSNDAWAAQFNDIKLDYQWRLATVEGNALQKAMDIIKKNGRMKWDDPKYVNRLKEELEVIAKNPVKDLTPYFLPIRDVLDFYSQNGFLTGPGRGSAGGSLFVYLLGITQIDPFDYDLPFNRFFSMDRIMMKELPDIDVDLESRIPLVGEDGKSGYLYGTYGDKAAQISTRTTIRLKSAIADANRYLKGKVEESVQAFTKGLPPPPQGVSDANFVFGYEDKDEGHIPGLVDTSEDLQKFIEKHPEEWEIVTKAMGLTRAFSRHASAFVVADVPIKDVVPTKNDNVVQYEAKEAEAAGLIKYDFLVINALADIRVALELIKKKAGVNSPNDIVGWYHPESDSGVCAECEDPQLAASGGDGLVDLVGRGDPGANRPCDRCHKPMKDANKYGVEYFPHNGEKTFIWKLPQLPEVFQSTWTGSTETCFQINTMSMIPHLKEMLPNNMMDIATLLALVRPGPLDFVNPDTGRNMVEEYMLLRKGEATPDIKELADLLPETWGVIAFQEQLGKIARDLCGFSGPKAETLRANMAKKRMEKLMAMKPEFMEGAQKKISKETAEKIWERMVTFGRYGFSVIHAVEYAHVTYACMFLKHYYPLEWWAAVLTNAKEQEITGKFWPYVRDLVAAPDINLSSDQMVVDYANNKIRAKFGVLRGMGEKSIDPIVAGRPYKDIQDFVNKDVAGPSLSCKLIHVGVLDSLFPAGSTLEQKLKMWADAVEIKDFNEKVSEMNAFNELAAEEGRKLKKMRSTQPKEGQIPEEYLNLTPMKDAAMKKAVLPSIHISFFDLGRRFSKVLERWSDFPAVRSTTGHVTRLVNGEVLERLDGLPGETVDKDVYVAATCYVVKAEEFSYSKNTKRALKMILDCDGYVSEKVLWPEYESGQLVYPSELKKGAIVTIFFRKRAGKKDMAIQGCVVENA
jgi:DNA polymerase III alpha subunit